MNLMRGAIDLGEQSLQIDCSACAGRRDYQFHCFFVISSEAEGEVEKSLDISDTSNLAAAETSLDMTQVFYTSCRTSAPRSIHLGFIRLMSLALIASREVRPDAFSVFPCSPRKTVGHTDVKHGMIAIRDDINPEVVIARPRSD